MSARGSLLRLTQTAEGEDKYRVEIALEGDGLARQTAASRFEFELAPQEREDLRWYLEEYLQNSHAPAPTIAARIEQRMGEVGTELFDRLFESSRDARDLWATLRDRLNDARVEIMTGVQEAASIPWELLRDPRTDAPLALRARSFVRAQPNPAQQQRLPKASGPIRVLLVICRPGGRDDVPFRSVAVRLIKGLSGRDDFKLDLLRPPTFEQLGRVLRQAKLAGRPYQMVHFDGHGVYEQSGQAVGRLSSLLYTDNRSGEHGYLKFEKPSTEDNLELIDGPKLGKLLAETNVPVLTLNACRSAHAEAQSKPQSVGEAPGEAEDADPHAQVRAFGSLAQEVMDAGVAGVVAMRYNVYVVTAAQFVAELYAALTRGYTLGEAVTLGRKNLHDQPWREIGKPIELQDWLVPVVYEAAPISLFSKPREAGGLKISLKAADAAPARGDIAPNLPKPPDAGFFGRDETLLALERAFYNHRIALLHAYAGSGKTATAAEFARWYSLTGGVEGPVLFTSFEQHKPLPRVLDTIEQVFGKMLEQRGVHWLALTDSQRRDVALQMLKQIPVLWIWDNVEPVAGFPAGAASAWSAKEQGELADFLRDARETKARFLLTSRRKESGWLGELPAPIPMQRMPVQERVQLARALVEKHGRRMSDVDDWMPLLRYTEGNPLTITVVVGQALRDGLTTPEQIRAFVIKLRSGEAKLDDDESEGRTKSLGASLKYGFKHAFDEDELKQLALLHLFQGFVEVAVLRTMGYPEADGHLPSVRGLTLKDDIDLLDRAAEVGLLTAHRGGYYAIHPMLPWYFKSLFDQYYPSSAPPGEEGQATQATRAFVEAMGALGNYYIKEYVKGNRDVIDMLAVEENNLLHARQLARDNGWWDRVISAMQGLRALYDQTGRQAEWARLVAEITPDFVDPATDGPLPGREDAWSLVTEYRVELISAKRQWPEAERLQKLHVDWDRQRAAPFLTAQPESLSAGERNSIRTLTVSLQDLGHIQQEQGKPECVEAFEEDYNLSLRIGDQPGAATTASNLGHAYKDIPALRDLAEAERWYQHSLKLHSKNDLLGQGKCWGNLGAVAYERIKEARAAKHSEEDQLLHLNNALQFYLRALDLLPKNAVSDLAVAHNQFGNVYYAAGDLDQALQHWRESIRYKEAAGDLYGAAKTRYNIAVALAEAGPDRLLTALDYARSALRNYELYGEGAADKIEVTQRLIKAIEEAMKQGG